MNGLSLGISSFYHDSAVALVDNTGILAAGQEERFSRKKGDHNFPKLAMRKLLTEIRKIPEDIEAVGYYELPKKKLGRILKTQITESPRGWRQSLNVLQNYDINQFKIGAILKRCGIRAPIYYFSHHESHAASAFYPSGFDEAAVLTLDGVGEWATATIGVGDRNGIKILAEMEFPNSIGLLYAAFTTFCGFKVNSGEYKLMGLAPFGEPVYRDLIVNEIVNVFDDGSILLNMTYFDFTRGLKMYSKKMEHLFGTKGRDADDLITKLHCDIACSIQRTIEEIVQKCAAFALQKTGKKKLVIAGGVALNCVANSTLNQILDLSDVFVQPAAGDAGGALGAAILANMNYLGNKNKSSVKTSVKSDSTPFKFKDTFLGTSYGNDEIHRTLLNFGIEEFELYEEEKLTNLVAEKIKNGEIVGWFQGRMEFGPRALGARSILADARDVEMQKRLNLKIKNRESFRPFAPMVLLEYVNDWFDWPYNLESPYMLFTCTVRKSNRLKVDNSFPLSGLLTEWVSRQRSSIPAVTHVDFSARIQTVDKDNPVHNVLKTFFEFTGVPIIVNTSFNVRGEPIVESPKNAIECFLQTEMDSLCIGNFFIQKKQVSKSVLKNAIEKRQAWDLD